MTPIKRFLIWFLAVYVVIGFGVNVLYGPPGFSNTFLEEYREETDHYLEVVKSQEYKLWVENPSAHPPSPRLERNIAFVEEFRANPDFREEMERRDFYNSVSDWFNVIMLTVLVVVLARGPLATFVSGMVTAERERIETVEQERSAAARRKSDAERKLDRLDDEREQADRTAAARIAEETAEIERSAEDALRMLQQEAEDRRRHEELLARRRLKAIIADEAIAILEQRYRSEQSAEHSDALIDQFLQELGERA